MKTKKELKWRLADLPTGDEVASLVEQKVITPDEARDILFNEEDKATANKVKEQQDEIRFLRELCDTLAAKSNGWTTIVREYHDYKPRYPGLWWGSYGQVISANTTNTFAAGTVGMSTATNSTPVTSYTVSAGTTQLLSKLN